MERYAIDDMARLRGMLGDAPTGSVAVPAPAVAAAAPGEPAVAAMKAILEAYESGTGANMAAAPPQRAPQRDYASPSMYDISDILGRLESGADAALHRVVEDADSDPEMREALQTDELADGMRLGQWEVHMRTEGRRKYYDVSRADDGAPIARDLLLYEAAHGIARQLNLGQPINAAPIRTLLATEHDYAGALADAIHFTHLLRGATAEARRPVFEARLTQAKQKAIAAKRRIGRLLHES